MLFFIVRVKSFSYVHVENNKNADEKVNIAHYLLVKVFFL